MSFLRSHLLSLASCLFLGRYGDRAQVLTVDMQGYELQADGSRGEPLDIGSVPCHEIPDNSN